jgi:ATP-dependent DNA ligase
MGDFEGLIGESEYGGGPVLVWNTGWFEPILEGDATVTLVLGKGVLDFVLHGHRLKGRFSLVKIKRKERDWLLIKRQDAEARAGNDITKEYQTSVISGRTLEDLKKLANPGSFKFTFASRYLYLAFPVRLGNARNFASILLTVPRPNHYCAHYKI